ncbi:CHAT domain-containing protein [Crassisporium funariophilum]|nr:CHAT domain-containing protein [Crassisporium funariophilum]
MSTDDNAVSSLSPTENLNQGNPPPTTTTSSETPSSECYLIDFAVECHPNDANHPALNGIGLTMLGLEGLDDNTLTLAKVSPTIWKYDGVVQLPAIAEELMVIAQSEDGGDLGHVYFPEAELGELRTSAPPSAQNRIRREFTTEEDGPKLTLLFDICIIPPDEETVQDVVQRPLLDRAGSTTAFSNPDNQLSPNAGRGPLQERSQHAGSAIRINNSIPAHDSAIQRKAVEDARFIDGLYNAGVDALERAIRTGRLDDANQAISLLEIGVNAAPEGHPELPGKLTNLGIAFEIRFQNTGDLTDISKAMTAKQKAVDLSSESDPDTPGRLINLGVSFLRLFERTGDLSDIDKAISFQRKALVLAREGDEYTPRGFCNLGSSLQSRFRYTGDPTDLSDAITAQHKAVDLLPEGHEDMAGWLNNLGASYAYRFNNTEDIADISKAIAIQEKAVRLAPEGHGEALGWLTNLGTSYRFRFERTGDLTDIDKAISVQQKSVQLVPKSHAAIPFFMDNLGASFMRRFEHTGDLADISEAISAQQKAVHLTPEGHNDLPAWLSNLGASFRARFERTGDLADISEATLSQRRSVRLTPDGHSDVPIRLNNLGFFLSCRFERTNDITDINDAIAIQQKAVDLTPDSNVGMLSTWLNNLGISFARRFRQTENLTDISEAIVAEQKAVNLLHEGHAAIAGRLQNLGISFEVRHESTGDLVDISDAISTQRKAVDLTPDGHANKPVRMNSLGNALLSRYKHTGDLNDIHEAVVNYRLSATYSVGPPAIRLDGARNWAQISQTLSDSSQTLEAYKTAIQLVSEVAGLEQTIQKRHTNLVDISDLSVKAAAAAISLERHETALEWLEQGRCLVWNQLNSLRTPLDDLRARDRRLADRFLEVSRALEGSGSRADFSGVIGSEASMGEKISLQEEADTHVKLAQQRDKLLAEVRSIPEFKDFLRPPEASQLLEHLPSDGPVIVINIHKSRCDALALLADSDTPLHIPLENITYEQADKLRNQLRRYLSSHGVRLPSRKPAASSKDESAIHEVLCELWTRVVKPILDSLGFTTPTSDPRRMWWCATGPLAFLPIHAAGDYAREGERPGISISDFVISSYTPSVTALIERVKRARLRDISVEKGNGLLMISQPDTPGLPAIPGTEEEITAIREHLTKNSVRFHCLEGRKATVNQVITDMETYNSVHFACHAIQNLAESLKSGFYLHDGQLELSEILKKQLPRADFAFLSACQTSTGDEKLSEEAVHLAAGMLAAGFQGVVATTWSIKDLYGPIVAGDFYNHLLSNGVSKEEGENGFSSVGAAHALHDATKRAREKLGDSESSLLIWVPYVHFGL